jgi:hypothetical protein
MNHRHLDPIPASFASNPSSMSPYVAFSVDTCDSLLSNTSFSSTSFPVLQFWTILGDIAIVSFLQIMEVVFSTRDESENKALAWCAQHPPMPMHALT